MSGRIFVISAPSGTGKTTVVRRLLKEINNLRLSVSCTTRAPRKSEKNGVDYHFISEEKFKEMVGRKAFLEHAFVHGSYYGTPSLEVEGSKENDITLLDIDVQGAAVVKKKHPHAVLIFLLPPSHEELVKRLSLRNADSKESLELRLKNAQEEILQKGFYDFQVVNDVLKETVEEIKKIIHLDALSFTR